MIHLAVVTKLKSRFESIKSTGSTTTFWATDPDQLNGLHFDGIVFLDNVSTDERMRYLCAFTDDYLDDIEADMERSIKEEVSSNNEKVIDRLNEIQNLISDATHRLRGIDRAVSNAAELLIIE